MEKLIRVLQVVGVVGILAFVIAAAAGWLPEEPRREGTPGARSSPDAAIEPYAEVQAHIAEEQRRFSAMSPEEHVAAARTAIDGGYCQSGVVAAAAGVAGRP